MIPSDRVEKTGLAHVLSDPRSGFAKNCLKTAKKSIDSDLSHAVQSLISAYNHNTLCNTDVKNEVPYLLESAIGAYLSKHDDITKYIALGPEKGPEVQTYDFLESLGVVNVQSGFYDLAKKTFGSLTKKQYDPNPSVN